MSKLSVDYYIYSHICSETNEILYIGRGRLSRAYGITRRSNKDHQSYLAKHCLNLNKIIKFLNTNLTLKEANKIEKEYIKKYKPKWNKQHNPDYKLPESLILKMIRTQLGEKGNNSKLSDKQRYRIIRAYDKGTVTVRQLAKRYGVGNHAICNILNKFRKNNSKYYNKESRKNVQE